MSKSRLISRITISNDLNQTSYWGKQKNQKESQKRFCLTEEDRRFWLFPRPMELGLERERERKGAHSGLNEFVRVGSSLDRDRESVESRASWSLVVEGLLADPLRGRRVEFNQTRTRHPLYLSLELGRCLGSRSTQVKVELLFPKLLCFLYKKDKDGSALHVQSAGVV